MNERIVVGATDSAASRRAVDWAVERAIDSGDQVELLSIVGGSIGVVGEGDVVQAALDRTHAMLSHEAQRVDGRGAHVDTRVARGKPVEQLIEASEGAALLVIGTDSRGEESAPARGLHRIRVAAGAHCPVAIVPDIDLAGRAGVLVGVDGSEASEAAIAFAASEADRHGESLTAVSAWSPVAIPLEVRSYPEDYLENMQRMTEESLAISLAGIAQTYPDLQVHRVVESGAAAEVVTRIAQKSKLAVVGSRGHGALMRFLLGSTSQAVIERISTPTVVVR